MDSTEYTLPGRATYNQDQRQPAVGKTKSARSLEWQDIAMNATYITIPMAMLTAAFVTVVYTYRIKPIASDSSWFTNPPTVPNDNALYVGIDSTMLVFLASWMSSIALFLTACVIALVTYPVATGLFRDTTSSARGERLPTAFQLSLMLKLINSSIWAGLWGLLQYDVNWKIRADRRAVSLNMLALTAIMAICLSALVFAADTWLHLATTTVTLTLATPLSSHQPRHSFALITSCLQSNNSLAALIGANTSCTLDGTQAEYPLYKPAAAIKTINNQSDITNVFILPGTNLSFLSPPLSSLNTAQDFVASTFAVRSSCQSLKKECNLVNNGNFTWNCKNSTWYCDDNTLGYSGFVGEVFRLADLTDPDDYTQYYGVQNPFYVAFATTNAVPGDSPLLQDSGLVSTHAPGIAGVFSCAVTVSDIRYAYNQGLPRLLSETRSNNSVTNMFASAMANKTFGSTNVIADLNMAAVTTSNVQEFAGSLAVSLSNALLSSAAGSIEPAQVEIAQQRLPILASRVPKAPFFLLISVDLAFVLVGLVLAFVAARTPWEGRQAQYRLTIAGLVASMFEHKSARQETKIIEELFEEYHETDHAVRIGIDRTSRGGFAFSNVISSAQNLIPERNYNTRVQRGDGLLIMNYEGFGAISEEEIIRDTN